MVGGGIGVGEGCDAILIPAYVEGREVALERLLHIISRHLTFSDQNRAQSRHGSFARDSHIMNMYA